MSTYDEECIAVKRCHHLCDDLSKYWITVRIPSVIRNKAFTLARRMDALQEGTIDPKEQAEVIRDGRNFLYDLLDPKKTPKVPVVYREAAYRFSRHYPLMDSCPQGYRSSIDVPPELVRLP